MVQPIELTNSASGIMAVASLLGVCAMAMANIVIAIIKNRRMGGLTWNDFVKRYELFNETITRLDEQSASTRAMIEEKFTSFYVELAEMKQTVSAYYDKFSNCEKIVAVLEDRIKR